MHIASYIGCCLVMVLLICLVQRGVPLGPTMLLGAVLVGLSSGMGPVELVRVMYSQLTSTATINLMLIVGLVSVLGYVMENTGSLEAMKASLSELVSDLRVALTLAPILMGILAVPGAAIFAAPVVGAIGDRMGLDVPRKVGANILFRHVLYFIYPLYSSFILFSQLSGLPFGYIIRFNLPTFVASFAVSLVSVFRGVGRNASAATVIETAAVASDGANAEGDGTSEGALQRVLALVHSILPLLVVLVLGIGFGLNFIVSAAIGVIVACANYVPFRKDWLAAVLRRMATYIIPGIRWPMVWAMAGVMIFQGVVSHSPLVSAATAALIRSGMPVLLLVTLAPLVVSFVTGSQPASMGLILPILMPLLAPLPTYRIYTALFYAASFAGYMMSPFHVCLALTNDYFNGRYKDGFRLMLPTVVTIILCAVLTAVVFSRLAGA